ncbi:MAG: DUF6384 family protein [Planctomycetota bacterium]
MNPEEMGIEEMLRIMDVATALRREQELVEREFNIDQIRNSLKKKLTDTAALTGEELSEEQIEAAVNWYYDNLHEYQEPPKSLMWYVAHLYVRRQRILQITIPVFLVLFAIWSVWFAPFAPYSTKNRFRRNLNAVTNRIDSGLQHLQSIAKSAELDSEIRKLDNESKTLTKNEELESLLRLESRLENIRQIADQEYTLTILSRDGQRSGFTRFFDDDFNDEKEKVLSGYYVIVEARKTDGSVVAHNIRNSETDELNNVKKWAEKVPQSVYNRLMKDKKSDGILNETTFAIKKRGMLQPEIVITDENQAPLQRTVQLTRW